MMVKALSEYFKKEGEVMGLPTYKAKGNDVPVKDYLLRRAFGSWSRVLSVVKKIPSRRNSHPRNKRSTC